MALVCNELGFLDALKKKQGDLLETKKIRKTFHLNHGALSYNDLAFETISGLEYIIDKDAAAFKTIHNFGIAFDIDLSHSKGDPPKYLDDLYDNLHPAIESVIKKAGLIGV